MEAKQMDKKDLIANLFGEMATDKDLRLEVLQEIMKMERGFRSDTVEALKNMVKANGIQYPDLSILNNNEKMVRELNRCIIERIGYCYVYEVNQADYRVYDAISEFCAQTTKGQYQDLQFYALMNFRVRLIDIFDLKEKLSAKFDKV